MKKRREKKISKITELVNQAEGIRAEIYKKILAIPQNPNIKIFSKSPSCFETNFGLLSADMVTSPSYYDFKLQCVNIVAYLDKKSIDKFQQALEEMTTPNMKGHCILKGQGYAYRLNPAVVKYLKKIL